MNQTKPLNPFEFLIERHIDDAAFLWALRSVCVKQPQFTQKDLKKLELRIEKHIDSLILSPDCAWQVIQSATQFEEGGEAFVMAMLAFRLMDIDKIQVATEFGLINNGTFKGLASALSWLPLSYSQSWVSRFLKSKALEHKRLALAICSIKRQNPGEYLKNIFAREDCLNDKPLYIQALKLIGELKRSDLSFALDIAQQSDDDDIVFWSCWSSILLGNKKAVEQIQPMVITEGKLQIPAIDIVFRALPVELARSWISELSRVKDSTRLVLRAIAVLGDTQAMSWVIAKMKDPTHARLAGEVFSRITGIDLEENDLANAIPQLFKEDQDVEEAVEEHSLEDDNLPWPNSEKIAASWQQYGNRFVVGVRYFMGREIDTTFLQSIIRFGGQRQRYAAALELALQDHHSVLVNVKATVQGEFTDATD